MYPSTKLVIFSLLFSSSRAAQIPGFCKPHFLDSLHQSKSLLQDTKQRNLSLVPVLLSVPESSDHSLPFRDYEGERFFSFGISFGPARCVESHYLGIAGEDKDPHGVFKISATESYGRASVHWNDTNGDCLVHLCETLDGENHVAQFFILQQKETLSKESIDKERLLRRYRFLLDQLGLKRNQMLGFSDGEFKFCDGNLQKQLNKHAGGSVFWFFVVVFSVMILLTIIGIVGTASRLYSAIKRLIKS